MEAIPAPPEALKGKAARETWTAILAEYELDETHLSRLRRICVMVDELTRIRAELSRAKSLTVPGFHGQPTPHPLLKASRDHAVAIERALRDLLWAVGTDNGGGLADAASKSSAGRTMALIRHSR